MLSYFQTKRDGWIDEGGQRQKDIDTDTKKSRKEGREEGKVNVGGRWRGNGQMDGWMHVWEGRRAPVFLEGRQGVDSRSRYPGQSHISPSGL